jgi:hypothetical protein
MTLEITIETEDNIFDGEIKCKLVSRRCDREKYYIHTFDPSIFFDNLDFKEKWEQSKENPFDFTKRNRCCNCVSMTLYAKYNSLDIIKYLSSIVKSAENMAIGLPDWILRLYMDVSVYDYIKNIKDGRTLNRLLSILYRSKNVEIYTSLCPPPEIIERLRINRYKALYDDDVNIKMIREADGVVTFQDCHNIRFFSRSNRLIYVVPVKFAWESLVDAERVVAVVEGMENIDFEIRGDKKRDAYYRISYSAWLCIYKEYLDKDFFSKNWNVCELPAGLFGTKLKLRKEFFLEKIQHVQKMINTYTSDMVRYRNSSIDKLLSNPNENYTEEELGAKVGEAIIEKFASFNYTLPDITQDDLYNTKDVVYLLTLYVNIGFDEILLLDIFKDYVSVPYTEIDMKILWEDRDTGSIMSNNFVSVEYEKLLQTLSIISSNHDTSGITVYFLGDTSIAKKVSELEASDKSNINLNEKSVKILSKIDELIFRDPNPVIGNEIYDFYIFTENGNKQLSDLANAPYIYS